MAPQIFKTTKKQLIYLLASSSLFAVLYFVLFYSGSDGKWCIYNIEVGYSCFEIPPHELLFIIVLAFLLASLLFYLCFVLFKFLKLRHG